MGWHSKGGGRYYTRSQRVGGRVVREYIGSGPLAEAVAYFDGQRRREAEEKRQQARNERQAWTKTQGAVAAFCQEAGAAAAEALEAAGYHRHRRGEWRKKRMAAANNQRPAGLLTQASAELLTQEQPEREQQERDLLEKAKTEGSVPRWQIRQALARMQSPPRTNLGSLAEDAVVRFLGAEDLVKQECMRREIDSVRQAAAGPDPSPLEVLLSDRLALCWAYVQVAEAQYVGSLSLGPGAESLVSQKRVKTAQGCYLSAIKALAQVRRLQSPALQFNLGHSRTAGQSEGDWVVRGEHGTG